MTLEFLNVNGVMVPHIVVPIKGDGACLFNSLSYLMYGNEEMTREVRKLIVCHVTKNWKKNRWTILFPYIFEVNCNYQLYERFGIDGYLVLRMRFTQNLCMGHFDVYFAHESEILNPQRDSTLQKSHFSLSMK